MAKKLAMFLPELQIQKQKTFPFLKGERWGLFSLAPQPHWYRTFAQRRQHTHFPEFQAKRDRIVSSDHLARVVWPEIIMQLPMRPLIFFATWWDLMGDHVDRVFWRDNKQLLFLGSSRLLFAGYPQEGDEILISKLFVSKFLLSEDFGKWSVFAFLRIRKSRSHNPWQTCGNCYSDVDRTFKFGSLQILFDRISQISDEWMHPKHLSNSDSESFSSSFQAQSSLWDGLAMLEKLVGMRVSEMKSTDAEKQLTPMTEPRSALVCGAWKMKGMQFQNFADLVEDFLKDWMTR